MPINNIVTTKKIRSRMETERSASTAISSLFLLLRLVFLVMKVTMEGGCAQRARACLTSIEVRP
eukprot:1158697-Pelagomonas_calceolata.AAC.9